MEIAVVDIFCGAGGPSHGFVEEDITVVAGVDSDASCRYAYEHNNGATFIHKKIEEVKATEILALYPAGCIKVLVGCAPCQPFSTYAQKKRARAEQLKDEMALKDEKWKLLASFAALIEQVQPDIVSMENVLQLKIFAGGSVYQEFATRLRKTYHVTDFSISCPEYGIPQTRRRLVLFASKFGEIDVVKPTHKKGMYKTVADTIKHLPPISAGQACADDPLHWTSSLSELNLKRIRRSVPGGTWRDWNDELRAGCHGKETGKSYPSTTTTG